MVAEDLLTQASHSYRDDKEEEDDDVGGWVDEQSSLLASDLKDLEEDVQLIRKTLVKVHCQCVQKLTVADVNSAPQSSICNEKLTNNSPL